jgi:hypothetical protein
MFRRRNKDEIMVSKKKSGQTNRNEQDFAQM